MCLSVQIQKATRNVCLSSWWVSPQTKWQLPPQSVSDGFLVFLLQNAIEPFALFQHSFCDYMYMCFTDEVADPNEDRTRL